MAGEYWRCKRCGNVWRQAPESVGNPNDGVRHRSGPGEPLCPGEWEPVVVIPVAEAERMRGIEARLRDDDMPDGFYGKMRVDDEYPFRVNTYRRAVLGEKKHDD